MELLGPKLLVMRAMCFDAAAADKDFVADQITGEMDDDMNQDQPLACASASHCNLRSLSLPAFRIILDLRSHAG